MGSPRPARPDASPAAPVEPGNRTIILGDSIAVAASIAPTTFGNGWFTYACLLSRQRMRALRNAGVSGNTTAQMLARLRSDVLAYKPAYCVVMGGTNDIGQRVPLGAVQTNLTTILAQLRQAGIVPILCTIPPTGAPPDRRRATGALNEWIATHAAAGGIALFDLYTPCLDTATSGWKAGYSDDGVHPNLTAQLACARAVQEAIEATFPDRTPPLAGVPDDALNLLQNAPFDDGDADGLADSPWFASGGGAPSAVAGPGGAGNVQVLATAGSAAGLQQNVLTGWSIGDRIAFAGLMSADAQAGGMTYSVRVAYADAALGQPRGFAPAHELAGDLPGEAVYYAEGVIPPGTLRLEVAFSVDNGRGSIRLGRPTLLNLTRLGF